MLGGLARRAALVKRVRAENPDALIVDSGDLFFSASMNADPERALKKAQLLGRAHRRMEAAAVNVGDLDLLPGLDFLKKESSQGLPLISANLLDSANKNPIFPPYLIKEFSGWRIAFFGLITPEFRPEMAPALKKIIEGRVLIKDPIQAAEETMSKLRGRADLIVLLSDLGLMRDQAVARAVAGIHFILGGHEGRFLKIPHQAGNTFIFQSSFKGMYVGKLRVTLENPGFPFKDEGRIRQIQEQISHLDRGLQRLQKAPEGQYQPNRENIERMIQDQTRRKEALLGELKRFRESLNQGNRFLFTMEPLELSHPEDEEIRGWIAQEGIERD